MSQAVWVEAVVELAADRERRAADAAGQLAAQLEALACIREAELVAADTAARNQLNADMLLAAAGAEAAWRELVSIMRAEWASIGRPLEPNDVAP
ncbi:MAG TPA: hypothetical protein PLD23_03905 [Armatimonadota bacterium]|nr:hypothetical protein [Armatimonadota bacterium]HQK92619.1 hypothetical protein [Armatimonadota bacterium]